MPPIMSYQLASLAIAGLFYMWRDVWTRRLQHNKLLRERVAYMLWVVANR